MKHIPLAYDIGYAIGTVLTLVLMIVLPVKLLALCAKIFDKNKTPPDQ